MGDLICIAIPAEIPGLLCKGSTVVCTSGNHAGRIGVVVDIEEGARHAVVAFEASDRIDASLEWVEVKRLSLNISDRTGAAHLAWWLRAQPARTRKQNIQDLEALGTVAAALIDAIEAAAAGIAVPRRALELLRDFGLLVAEVTRG